MRFNPDPFAVLALIAEVEQARTVSMINEEHQPTPQGNREKFEWLKGVMSGDIKIGLRPPVAEEPGTATQLDRIEAKLDMLINHPLAVAYGQAVHFSDVTIEEGVDNSEMTTTL
jgi:hypothetical protein